MASFAPVTESSPPIERPNGERAYRLPSSTDFPAGEQVWLHPSDVVEGPTTVLVSEDDAPLEDEFTNLLTPPQITPEHRERAKASGSARIDRSALLPKEPLHEADHGVAGGFPHPASACAEPQPLSPGPQPDDNVYVFATITSVIDSCWNASEFYPLPDGTFLHVDTSDITPHDRIYQAPEGFRIIPVDEWVEGQKWLPLGCPTTYTPFLHHPRRPRTHVMVRDTPPPPPTERVPWHEAVGRFLPDGQMVRRVGMSAKYPHGAVSHLDGSDALVAWHSASEDGSVEVLR